MSECIKIKHTYQRIARDAKDAVFLEHTVREKGRGEKKREARGERKREWSYAVRDKEREWL